MARLLAAALWSKFYQNRGSGKKLSAPFHSDFLDVGLGVVWKHLAWGPGGPCPSHDCNKTKSGEYAVWP